MVLNQATPSSFGPTDNANEIAAATFTMGTFRKFQLTLFSATGLRNPRKLFEMKVYAVVSIGGVGDTEKKKTKKKTPVDKKGGKNPCWNHKMDYAAKEATIHNEDTVVSIKLYCARSLQRDKYVGEVNLPLKMLFDQRTSIAEKQTYKVFKCKGGRKDAAGRLDISCAFEEPILADEEVSAENAEDQVRPGMVTLKKAGRIVLVGVKVGLAVGMVFL